MQITYIIHTYSKLIAIELWVISGLILKHFKIIISYELMNEDYLLYATNVGTDIIHRFAADIIVNNTMGYFIAIKDFFQTTLNGSEVLMITLVHCIEAKIS